MRADRWAREHYGKLQPILAQNVNDYSGTINVVNLYNRRRPIPKYDRMQVAKIS